MTTLVDTVQFKNGKDVETFLDDYFRKDGFSIIQTTPHEERVLCIGDRKFSRGGKSFTVEYKSGIQTAYTGNIFLEIISVDTEPQKPGWVYTCNANYILYAALLNHKILVFTPDKLRLEIESLKAKFKVVKTSKGQNKGYNTHGVIVPFEYAEKWLAEKVINLEIVTAPYGS